MRTIITTLAAALFAFAAPAVSAEPDEIRYTVKELRNDKGLLRCALYKSDDGWLEGNPPYSAQTPIKGRSATCVFKNIPPGTYAIAALHDEDRDKEMDTILGIPEEGHAASKNAQEDELKPDWEDARFNYKGGVMNLSARMEY